MWKWDRALKMLTSADIIRDATGVRMGRDLKMLTRSVFPGVQMGRGIEMLTGSGSNADRIRSATGVKIGRGIEMLTGFGSSAVRIRDTTGVQMGRDLKC